MAWWVGAGVLRGRIAARSSDWREERREIEIWGRGGRERSIRWVVGAVGLVDSGSKIL